MSLVGFIGLGNMGGHMARNLIKNGKKLIVFDVNQSVTDQFKADGCQVARHPADVAAAAKEIITVLPSSPHVKNVYTSDNGIFRTIQPGTLCMDSSTIDQIVSIEMSREAAKNKAEYIDTPISGGVTGAQNATLTFMVGAGSDKTFERARAVLELMGKNIVNLGSVGNGQAAKICNNMLLGIQMIAVAETMNLGITMGLSPKQLAGIINTSSGRCWSSDTYNPVPGVIEGIPCNKGYAGGFGTTLMAKDLSLAQNASTNTQAPTPLGSLAHQIYRILARDPEYQAKDFGVVYNFLKKQNV